MRDAKYKALVLLGIHFHDQWEDAKRKADTAAAEDNEYMTEHYRGEMRDLGNRLQALGDAAVELFGRKYDDYMRQVHDRVVTTSKSNARR